MHVHIFIFCSIYIFVFVTVMSNPCLSLFFLYGRSRFRSLKSLFGSTFYRQPDHNKVTGVYELLLKKCDEGSPGRLHAVSHPPHLLLSCVVNIECSDIHC